ncbi:MAG: GTPase Era [Mariprofundaceae bacterium]|nr:GTPase Era [Mariprofundaceae bacterium]
MSIFRCGRIALLGRPNVGKSTLMNKIIGARVAIVTPKPQTTRHRILGIHTTEQAQMIFVDTPGIHKGKRQLNKNMVRIAYAAAEEADVLAIMQDASRPLDHITARLISRFAENNLRQPRIHILNKVDKMDKALLLPRLQEIQTLDPTAKAFIPLSAKKGNQVDGFLKTLIEYLPEAEADYDADWYTDQSQRQLAAEYVREQVFLAMHQEIPFQTAVDIEVFKETAKGLHIEAVILVGSESHKPMVIGKSGEKIKRMGITARKGLETLFDQHVDLRLWVKIDSGWFDHPMKLEDLGLGTGF